MSSPAPFALLQAPQEAPIDAEWIRDDEDSSSAPPFVPSTSAQEPWGRRIKSFRGDGSLAQEIFLLNDGARVVSRYPEGDEARPTHHLRAANGRVFTVPPAVRQLAENGRGPATVLPFDDAPLPRPGQPGHHFRVGPNLICPPGLDCSPDMIRQHLAQHSVPGRLPSDPISFESPNWVYWNDIPAGRVNTRRSDDGLTVTNRTVMPHIFYDGEARRRAFRGPDGGWYVETTGFGNHFHPVLAIANQLAGPGIFQGLDQRMRKAIENLHQGSTAP